MKRVTVTTGLLLALASAPTNARPPDVYGPAPDWGRYKEVAEPGVRAKIAELAAKGKLAGPDTWSIRWPNGYMKGGWRHKGRFTGYLSCGMLVATTPQTDGRNVINFVTVIDFDRVQTVDISDRQSNSLVNVMCEDLVSRGVIPPADVMEQQAQQRAIPALGLKIRHVPEGASVIDVTAGSVADRSGLKTGMVISHANGIALAGLGAATANILESSAASLQLRMTDGQIIELRRTP